MNISISLTPELLDLVKATVDSGRYTSISEVVREALRRCERTEQLETERTESLRRAWRQAIDSGHSDPLDITELHAASTRKLTARRI